MDYAGPVNGKHFLVVVDALTKWPEIFMAATTTSAATIEILREIFARFGMPSTLVSDNGTQFSSEVFANFCAENGVHHIFTPPYHPQSNGQAERFVDTLKRALRKLEGEGTMSEIVQIFLLNYRSTPNPSAPDGKSPAEAVFGRTIRTSLDLLRPPSANLEEINEDMEAQYNRRHGAKQKYFNVGDMVYVPMFRNNTFSWELLERKGKVCYNVQHNNGRIIQSHANQLRIRIGDHIKPQPVSMLYDYFGLSEITPQAHCPQLPPIPEETSTPRTNTSPIASLEVAVEEPPNLLPSKATIHHFRSF